MNDLSHEGVSHRSSWPAVGEANQLKVLALAALSYIAVFAYFYPPIHTSMDESTYLNMAYAYRQGTQYADVAGVTYTLGFQVRGDHSVGIYPPTIPLLLAGLSYFGWPAVFSLNLILHLGLFGAVAWLLRVLRVPPVFALLYLFHPTAVIFSRTVMSDFASSLLMVLSIVCFLRRRWYWCGAMIGMTLLIRHANLIALPLLALGCLFDRTISATSGGSWKERFWIAVRCGMGAAPFFLAAFAFQAIVQEGGWSRIHVVPPSLRYLPTILPVHASSLMILYPCMLLAPLLYRGYGKVSLCVLLYGFVLFFGCFYTYDVGSSWAETFVVRQRYLLAVIPIFIALYAVAVWRFIENWEGPSRQLAGATASVLLFAATIAIHARHDRYLQKMALVRSEILRIVSREDVLFCNMQIAKLFHPAWGARAFSIVGGNYYRAEFAKAREKIAATRLEPSGRIVLANWSRDYRSETGVEGESIQQFKAAFILQPLTSSERGRLPEDVQVFDLSLRPRNETGVKTRTEE